MSSFQKNKEKICADIPPELIFNILVRLPIVNLLRLRHVCKSWNRLIISSSFISQHLNSSISNTESRVTVGFATEYGEYEYYYLHRDNQAFDEIKELEPPRKSNANILIHGSSNGVFCCSGYRDVQTTYEESLILWNPSLSISMILPKSREGILSKHPQYCYVGFGFLPSTDNFKIVRVIYTQISLYNCILPPEAEIYEHITSSWRNLDATKLSYVLTHNDQALLNGIVHWTARDTSRAEGTITYGGLLVSFDLTSEEFGTLMFPRCLQNDNEPLYCCVNTWKESLCLMHTNLERFRLYIMKEYGKTDSWENMINFERISFMPLYLRENGDILGAQSIDDRYTYFKLVSCDPKTNEKKDLGLREDARYFCKAYAYVDSLFLLKDLNESNGEFQEI